MSSTSRAHSYAAHCNTTFAKSTTTSSLPGPEPTAQVAIITCMDARLDVFAMFGLQLGESHVIRVGGGRVADALRSLVASEQVLGTKEVMVVHHTDCGFSRAKSTDAVYKEVKAGLGGGVTVEWIPFMPILEGFEKSVKEDVELLRRSPVVKKEAIITGWVYDTFKGTIQQIV